MSGLRERRYDDGPGPDQDAGGGIGDNLGSLREQGEDLLSAADQAIDHGLSRESQAFVTNMRQSSGQ